jgi:hypothetical protein
MLDLIFTRESNVFGRWRCAVDRDRRDRAEPPPKQQTGRPRARQPKQELSSKSLWVSDLKCGRAMASENLRVPTVRPCAAFSA